MRKWPFSKKNNHSYKGGACLNCLVTVMIIIMIVLSVINEKQQQDIMIILITFVYSIQRSGVFKFQRWVQKTDDNIQRTGARLG